MIAQIEGQLESLETDSAIIRVGQVCYEVLLPGYAVSELAGQVGAEVTLCTMEYYEAAPGGGNIIPRLVGFLNKGEKQFFAKYTSVKGMGIRKGLKSLTIPIATIAAAIEAGDEKILQSLPSVGKRFAQLMIAQLKGKLGDYAAAAERPVQGGEQMRRYQLEALEILIAWGEKRGEAMELISMASRKHPDIRTAEDLVPLVYRLKQGVEV